MDDAAVVTPPYVARPARLLPFHGLSIAASRLGDPASARAFARPYRDVPARLRQWEREGRLWRDPEPALYLLEYTSGGLTVRGLVGALDLTRHTTRPEEAAVLPHEGIHPARADNLARRMEQMQLNPAPIVLVHRADAALRRRLAGLRATPPVLETSDRSRQRYRLWALRDAEALAAVAAALAPTRAVIADGHHRYGAYLQLQGRATGTGSDRGLAMVVDQDDTPLFLGPIHRTLAGVGLADLEAAARRIGTTLVRLPREEAVAALAPETVVVTDGHDWAVVRLAPPPGGATVETLHRSLLAALAGTTPRVAFHHTVEDALHDAESGHGLAVLLPAPELDQVERIVRAGRLLPEKATSFQPKPVVGVLMRSLLDG